MLSSSSSRPAAPGDPLAQIDKLPSMDEAAARQLCQHLLSRELGREPVYRRLLEVCLGFCQKPPTSGTDGGWLQRPRRHGSVGGSAGGKDPRVPLLSSDPRYAWNALHVLKALRDTREVQLDELMLNYRAQDYLNGEPSYEETADDNAKRLWQEIYYNRTLPRMAPTASSSSGTSTGTGTGNAGGATGAGGGQAGGSTGGGAATAAGGADGSLGLTRLPLLLPLLDHYFFCFAYWAVARKRSAGDFGGMTMHRRKELYDYELQAAQGLLTPRDIVAKQGVYFEILQSYIQGYFPRETGPETRGLPLDLERALRVTPEAEKFLRILIESWLERNGVTNPNLKAQAEPSVAEHQLHPQHSQYQPLSADQLHGLLLLVSHLVARKVDADVAAAAAQGRSARLLQAQCGPGGATPLCPALDALQQPLFVFLLLAFRHLRVAPQCWTQFLLAGELWLAWIDPDRTWRQTFGGEQQQSQQQQQAPSSSSGSGSGAGAGAGTGAVRGAAGARWRELHLRAHVAGNLHFYTTLFVLYCRKAREALGADASRQYQVLAQALRVMRVFRDTALHDALQAASRHAAGLWQAGSTGGPAAMLALAQARAGAGGRDPLLHHLRALRLLRSRPCLVADACQDAHHLAAELLAAKRRAEKDWEAQQRAWTAGLGRITGLLGAAFEAVFGDVASSSGYDDPPSGGAVKLPELIATMEQVLAEVFGIFPSLEAKCQRPAGDADAAASRDAERKGLLLTARGREQLLLGVRGCDPTKARYLGDPLFEPELGEHEVALLVRWAQRLSVALSQRLHPEWQPPAEALGGAPDLLEQRRRQQQQQQQQEQDGGHINVRQRVGMAGKPTPVNLRFLADRRHYYLPGLMLATYLGLAMLRSLLQL